MNHYYASLLKGECIWHYDVSAQGLKGFLGLEIVHLLTVTSLSLEVLYPLSLSKSIISDSFKTPEDTFLNSKISKEALLH